MVEESQICIAIDTLAISGTERTPQSFISKYAVLPHLQVIVTGTGHGLFIDEWMAMARGGIIARDIDHLNLYTPGCLRKIAEKYPELSNISVTIYHFGFSNERNRFLCYVYRSSSQFEAEEILFGVGIKPAIEYKIEDNFELPKKFIEIMKLQQKEDFGLPISERIGIGGDIHFLHMTEQGIHISCCHRFDTYEKEYEQMCQKLQA